MPFRDHTLEDINELINEVNSVNDKLMEVVKTMRDAGLKTIVIQSDGAVSRFILPLKHWARKAALDARKFAEAETARQKGVTVPYGLGDTVKDRASAARKVPRKKSAK